jgi:hypothetical protein
MSYNMMIGYDIYDCFTMEHFRLRQRMTLTTKIYCSRLYVKNISFYCDSIETVLTANSVNSSTCPPEILTLSMVFY